MNYEFILFANISFLMAAVVSSTVSACHLFFHARQNGVHPWGIHYSFNLCWFLHLSFLNKII